MSSDKTTTIEQPAAATEQALLIDAKSLAHLIGVSSATIARMKSAGKLPRSLRVSANCIRWRRETIEKWLVASERAGHLLDRAEWEALDDDSR